MGKLFRITFFLSLAVILSFVKLSTIHEQNYRTETIGRELENRVSAGNLNIDLDFGKIPLYFIHNEGQVDEKALYYAKASRYTLWLTRKGLVFDKIRRIDRQGSKSLESCADKKIPPKNFKFERDVSTIKFLHSRENPDLLPVDITEHRVNHFIGNDASEWKSNIPTSNAVLYRELYRNIDLKVYGVEKEIEYDWLVKPGGNVEDIQFEFHGIKETKIDEMGNLVVDLESGKTTHSKPNSYQRIGGKKKDVEVKFRELGNNRYGFEAEGYDKDHNLVIDPVVLLFSTYLGGTGNDEGYSIAVNDSGNAYVTGYTASINFPNEDPYMNDPDGGLYDAFVTKFSASGSSLVYSTYLGGIGNDEGRGIAVDSSGNAYVTGYTASTSFPVVNAYMTDPDGGLYDAFVTKLSASGDSLTYSTYLGGTGNDEGHAIAVYSGNAYVTGYTASTNFPYINAYMSDPDGGLYDAFVTKLSTSGSTLVYSTYLGGTGSDEGFGIAVDSGNAYVTGYTASTNFPYVNAYMNDPDGSTHDAFVTKLSTSGSSLVYSTYLGGTGSDGGFGIAVDSGNAYVTGYTASTNFPREDAYMSDPDGSLYDAFVTKLSTSGSSLIYSTYLGGTGSDQGRAIAVDNAGRAYVTGYTASTNFPSLDAYMNDPDGSTHDAFVTKLSTSGSALIYSTYLGGTGSDQGYGIAVNDVGNAYVVGFTASANFPTANAYMNDPDGSIHDAFITKLSSDDAPPDVIITNPTDGATVSGTATVQATASDDDSVTKVDFYIDGALKTSDTSAPYAYAWDTKTESNGDHTVEATAYDTIGQSDSDEISVTVNNVVTFSLTIAANAGGTTDPSPGKYGFISGAQVAVDAIPNTGYGFTFWTGDVAQGDKTNNPLIVTMNKNISITANFYQLPIGYATYIFDGNDFNGDGASDASVFRSSTGRWHIRNVGTYAWGQVGDLPVNGDYNGDGTTDIAVWRPSNGRWYIRGDGIHSWGCIGDIPVPGNYDGDAGGKTDLAVWRPSEGRWYIKESSGYVWGQAGDIPVPGDYDGNGTADIAVWRPSNGRWYILGQGVYQWGTSGDIPIPGDYNGDGKEDIAVWRPSNGRWYILGFGVFHWGTAGDIPTPGDYDGNGTADIAVWRPMNGRWYLKGLGGYIWGIIGDIPLVR
jgi:hypothetical protein